MHEAAYLVRFYFFLFLMYAMQGYCMDQNNAQLMIANIALTFKAKLALCLTGVARSSWATGLSFFWLRASLLST